MKVFRAGLSGLLLTITMLVLALFSGGQNLYINILIFGLGVAAGWCLGYVLIDWWENRDKYRKPE